MAKHCGDKGCGGPMTDSPGWICICCCPGCHQARHETSQTNKVMHGPYISETPGVCGGWPCIDRTRITAAFIYEFARTGYTPQAIKDMYPHLEVPQIVAAIEFISKNIEHWLDHKAQYFMDDGELFAAQQEEYRKVGLIDADGKAIPKEWPPEALKDVKEIT